MNPALRRICLFTSSVSKPSHVNFVLTEQRGVFPALARVATLYRSHIGTGPNKTAILG